jgi:hypothetical protein
LNADRSDDVASDCNFGASSPNLHQALDSLRCMVVSPHHFHLFPPLYSRGAADVASPICLKTNSSVVPLHRKKPVKLNDSILAAELPTRSHDALPRGASSEFTDQRRVAVAAAHSLYLSSLLSFHLSELGEPHLVILPAPIAAACGLNANRGLPLLAKVYKDPPSQVTLRDTLRCLHGPLGSASGIGLRLVDLPLAFRPLGLAQFCDEALRAKLFRGSLHCDHREQGSLGLAFPSGQPYARLRLHLDSCCVFFFFPQLHFQPLLWHHASVTPRGEP